MSKIKSFFTFFLTLFAVCGVKVSYSGLTTYGDAVRSGVFDQTINIDYSDQIFVNKSLNARLLTILSRLGAKPAKTTTVKGFDKKLSYNVLTTAASTSTASNAGDAVDFTLASTEQKMQMVEGSTVELVPTGTPDETTTTRYAYVYSKTVSGDTGDVKVTLKPINPALKIIATTSGAAFYVLGTWYAQYSTSVKPVSRFPSTITNYVQLFKTPYEYSEMAAKENLYVKGTLKQMLDDDAKRAHLIEREISLLFNGPGYSKHVAATTETLDIGYQQGIVYTVRTASGAKAVKSYTAGTWSYSTFEDFAFKLFDPEIDDEPGKRLLVCNKATVHFFTELESQKLVKMTPNNTYGIPGIRSVETSWGMFDLLLHPRVDERYKTMADPWGLALHLGQIEHKPYIPSYLAANIQAPDVTGYKSEYRVAETVLVHNAATHHGMFYAT